MFFLQMQLNYDLDYQKWPDTNLQYCALGLDVGYWDGGYYW